MKAATRQRRQKFEAFVDGRPPLSIRDEDREPLENLVAELLVATIEASDIGRARGGLLTNDDVR